MKKRSKKFSKVNSRGKRLSQNHIKLRETKLGQYHVTLPKGIVQAFDYNKGDVFKVVVINGNITLVRQEDEEE